MKLYRVCPRCGDRWETRWAWLRDCAFVRRELSDDGIKLVFQHMGQCGGETFGSDLPVYEENIVNGS